MNNTEDSQKARKKPKIQIRQMELDDLAAVFHMGERLFTAREAPNLYRTWDEYELIELFYADSELCFVVEAEEGIVGFALCTTIEKERSAWKYGHLVWLGILPEFQRSGLGERIFNHVKEVMTRRGVRMLVVDTEADNLPALRFFRKMGFGKPEEHIYLSLNLSGQKRAGLDKEHPPVTGVRV
jgi:ribosomal protein S18 acetylase RimI-like enzyme